METQALPRKSVALLVEGSDHILGAIHRDRSSPDAVTDRGESASEVISDDVALSHCSMVWSML